MVGSSFYAKYEEFKSMKMVELVIFCHFCLESIQFVIGSLMDGQNETVHLFVNTRDEQPALNGMLNLSLAPNVYGYIHPFNLTQIL